MFLSAFCRLPAEKIEVQPAGQRQTVRLGSQALGNPSDPLSTRLTDQDLQVPQVLLSRARRAPFACKPRAGTLKRS